MPNIIKDLVIDRVDLVDEGANSAAFIELFKRKESAKTMTLDEILLKMKPEHAEVVKEALAAKDEEISKANETITAKDEEITKANEAIIAKDEEITKANETITAKDEEISKANETISAKDGEISKANDVIALYKSGDACTCDGDADENGICASCGKPKKKEAAAFDEEEVLKGMPEAAKEMFLKMRSQKEIAEEAIRKAKEAEQHAEAVAKAATLKSLPIESEKLISIVKKADTELLECLTAVNNALDGVVLSEVGKSRGSDTGADAWSKIEAEAEIVAKRDNISKQKAIAVVVKENPELYRDYLKEV